jgi:hypothetical protein
MIAINSQKMCILRTLPDVPARIRWLVYAFGIHQGSEAAMGITTSWGNEAHTYIVVKYEVPWTWEQYDTSTDEIVEMMQGAARKPVDVILDASAAPYPPSPAAMQHFQRAWEKLAPTMGMVVVVGAGGFFKMVGNTFARVFIKKDTMRFVDTLAEADRIMLERASTG